MTLLAICLAGAAGTGARYLAAVAVGRWLGTDFPYGTLLVNVAGSFLIGAIQGIAGATARVPESVRLTLGVGLMGGFTTYSAFAYETVALAARGAWVRAAANVAVTTAAALLACAAGWLLARAAVGAR